MDIQQLAKQKILILDGAMGTMIQQHQLEEKDFRGTQFLENPVSLKGNNDLLSISQPDIIRDIHFKYLEAGADIIETNTFNANRISFADYELEKAVYEVNVAAVQLALDAIEEFNKKNPGQQKFVAGSIGPTNRTASLSPDVNRPGFRAVDFDTLVEVYKEQVAALVDGGAHLLLVETVFDTLNAKACLFAIQEVFEQKGKTLPIMVSGTITDASGRTLSGQTTEAFYISLSHFPILSIGLNCALGASQLRPYLQTLDQKSDCLVSAHPNAGLPNAFGEYDQTPELMADQIKTYLDLGLVNIVGGCCGTTPAHIRQIAELARNYSPRKIAENV